MNAQPSMTTEERREAAYALVAEAFAGLELGPPEWSDSKHLGRHCIAERGGQEVVVQLSSIGRVEVENRCGYGNTSIEYTDARKLAKSIAARWKRSQAADAKDERERMEADERRAVQYAAIAEAEKTLDDQLGVELRRNATDVRKPAVLGAPSMVAVYMHKGTCEVRGQYMTPVDAVQLIHTLMSHGWAPGLGREDG